jgi:ferredoxin
MRLIVDRDKCIGSGMCTGIAPSFFKLDETGDLVVLMGVLSAQEVEPVQDAIDCCPVEALALEK